MPANFREKLHLVIVSASILVPFWRPGRIKNEVFAWEGSIFWQFQSLQDEMLFWLRFEVARDRIFRRLGLAASLCCRCGIHSVTLSGAWEHRK